MVKGKPDAGTKRSRLRMAALFVLAGVALAVAAALLFKRSLGEAIYQRAVERRVAGNALDLPDGLHLALCGTGSPLPDARRAGPCAAVIAGGRTFVVDAGEGAARNLNRMGVDLGALDGVLLTHFHSDHIDGLGPLALLHWTQGTAKEPLALYGPEGVEQVAEGFDRAYAQDKSYRIAHHGTAIVPESGGGVRAVAFPLPAGPVPIYRRDGLTITAFPVTHGPVSPAVGYRFDYRGRSLVISGDTSQSAVLETVARGADLLLHEALQPRLVGALTRALDAHGQPHTATITRDILDYHTTPAQAAESARRAGVRQLVLTHIVPQIPSRLFYPAFLGDAADRFDGPITVGEDGMLFSLLPGSEEIGTGSLL